MIVHICLVFNVKDSFPYGGTFEPPIWPADAELPTLSSLQPQSVNHKEDVLENEIIASPQKQLQLLTMERSASFQCYMDY